MILDKIIYLILIYYKLYQYIVTLCIIRNIDKLKNIKLRPSSLEYVSDRRNILSVFYTIETLFCYIINSLLFYSIKIKTNIKLFFNSEYDEDDNILKRCVLVSYKKLEYYDDLLYKYISDYIRNVIFKKITNYILDEMTNNMSNNMTNNKDDKDNKNDKNNLFKNDNMKNILSESFKMFDEIIKNKSINKKDIDNISKSINSGIQSINNNNIFKNLLEDIKKNDKNNENGNIIENEIKRNNNKILLDLKDKLN